MSGNSDDMEDQNNAIVTIDFTPVCWYGIACYRKNPEHLRKFRHPHLLNDSGNEEAKESVEIKIEIGHDATLKTANYPQGHSHDWTAFVRCTNHSATGFFLQKVEFNFPQTLARPPFVVNQPPFYVTDSGSRSFVMDIDISFKSIPDPKKTRINYDLYIKENASFSNVQLVKLVIQNPSSDFRQRLLLAGGVMTNVLDNSAFSSVRHLLPSTSLVSNKRKIDAPTTAQPANDEVEAFGKLCTSKLRKLETQSLPQKILAEKLISEVLFLAEQKSLTNDSSVHIANQSSISDLPSPPQIKTEPVDVASSSLQDTVIKSEDNSPSSSTGIQRVIKSEVNSPSSSAILPQVKIEVESPSSSSNTGESVTVPDIKQEVSKPLIINIKKELGVD